MRGSRTSVAGLVSGLAISATMMVLLAASVMAASPAVHRVSVGGPDSCAGHGAPHLGGCDGSYSLTATLYADGSASGRYVDRFSTGNGIVGVIDCVVVVDNQAWISGWITSGDFEGDDLAGLPFTTLVVDNGTSASDPPDQLASSNVGDPTPCTEMVEWDLFDAPAGQVTIS